LKHLTIYLFLFVFSLNSAAQNINLQLTGKTIAETKVIDSLNYLSKHKNIKSITNEIQLLSKKLSNIGFIENDIISETKISDSNYNAKLNLGERIKTTSIHI
jgi:hypothetical protein